MKKNQLACVVVLLLAGPLLAQQPANEKIIEDKWDAVYLEGAKIGHYHTLVREFEREGKKLFETRMAMNLQVKRYNAIVPLRMATSTEETADGKIVNMVLTQFLDNGQMVVEGKVQGDKILVGLSTLPVKRPMPWNDAVMGPYMQSRLLKERKVKPGDKIEFSDYQLALFAPVKMTMQVNEPEKVDLLVAKKEGDKIKVERVQKTLLRVDGTFDKVASVQLPGMTTWYDEQYESLRGQTELPGFGQIILYRTSKEAALEKGAAPELLPDLGFNSIVKLSKPVPRIHDANEVLYRITVKGTGDPNTMFAKEARQEMGPVQGKSFDLRVKGSQKPPETPTSEKPAQEFLESNFFLDHSAKEVQALVEKAAGGETEPWKKAQRIEKWVHDNMRSASDIGFCTASQVARDLRGDCRQHAMLTAALCKAAGIPARTALGLVYVQDPQLGPILGFHMWTEVWVNGTWLGLDATLGQGKVGGGHLKIVDASWAGVQTLKPMLPVLGVVGKINVEVVEVK